MAAKHWLSRNLVVSPAYLALFIREDDFRKELTRLKLPKEKWPPPTQVGCGSTTFIDYKGRPACIVRMPLCPNTTIEQYHALLVHEAVHVWQFIRERIGEDSPSSEFEAYSIQGIAQELMLAFKAQRRKKK